MYDIISITRNNIIEHVTSTVATKLTGRVKHGTVISS